MEQNINSLIKMENSMTERAMEAYLSQEGYNILNGEGCIDSTKVVDIAVGLGYETSLDEEKGLLEFELKGVKNVKRQVIGNVAWKDERGHKRHFVAHAEGLDYELISTRNVEIGDCILCDVIIDDGDDCHIYLEDKNLPFVNIAEWNRQEDEATK